MNVQRTAMAAPVAVTAVALPVIAGSATAVDRARADFARVASGRTTTTAAAHRALGAPVYDQEHGTSRRHRS
ncbi:hypothetical protein ACFWP7_19915 [Streptomyces sp. NPDC058470]|uniref:hypothetical protein n=1 Tax=Streptomyces sp. NPDC058470 TaxID=3346515 RepID=UPI00365B6974